MSGESPEAPDHALYEVLIVKHGTRQTVKSDVFLNFPLYGEPDESIQMDYFFWVIRNAERTVVVDTGYSAHGGEVRARTVLISPPTAFELLGITPDSAPAVIITHAHYDHTGNVDYFDASEIVLARAEYEFWTGRHASRTQFHHSIEEYDLVQLDRAKAEGRLTLFDSHHTLAPGIEIIQVGGHTPGQSVVRVATSEGTVLLASDSVHFYEEYERDMPFTYVADLVKMYEAFDLIRDMNRSGEADHVVSGHDAETLSRFRAWGADGPFAGLAASIGRIEVQR
ncbi:N-acyl homoserine lactonase family protein [Agreia bicolorata]|uniref:N-acyl homoserine lactonase family protein n=1 Tax=Agreia bicolorata TaxID=110935 RepID=UPI0005CAD5DD|nr:N-acyl homoserine lactonase family protein [Agreia bicolorata]